MGMVYCELSRIMQLLPPRGEEKREEDVEISESDLLRLRTMFAD